MVVQKRAPSARYIHLVTPEDASALAKLLHHPDALEDQLGSMAIIIGLLHFDFTASIKGSPFLLKHRIESMNMQLCLL
jgi:hypothetical protein